MTALAGNQGLRFETWKHRQFTLKAGQHAYKGGVAVGNTADGKIYEGSTGATFVFLGIFDGEVDATASGPLGAVDQPANVDLLKERTILWRANAGDISAANLYSLCYVLDDATVTLTASTNSIAGTIMAVDPVFGVAFEVKDH